MKVISTAAVALLAGSANAFAPSASKASLANRICDSSSCLAMNKVPFFAQQAEEEAAPAAEESAAGPSTNAVDVMAEAAVDAAKAKAENAELDALTMEEEVELLVQKELNKTKRMSNLRNSAGVEYAPWMGITVDEETKIRSLMRDRTEARRKRQVQEQDVSGNLFRDSQAQELSGTGLSFKIIDGEVELQWATKTELDTKGFIVKRRAAKTNDYSVIASYDDWGPLQSKGKEGGVYRYLDTTAAPGGWVYRISEADSYGNEADVCQCLVEVETEDEAKAAVIAGVGFGVFAVLVLVAGVAMDPMNGY
jgi:hypothetical protein